MVEYNFSWFSETKVITFWILKLSNLISIIYINYSCIKIITHDFFNNILHFKKTNYFRVSNIIIFLFSQSRTQKTARGVGNGRKPEPIFLFILTLTSRTVLCGTSIFSHRSLMAPILSSGKSCFFFFSDLFICFYECSLL